MSAEQLAEEGAEFDVVIASEVVEHVRAPAAFCRTLTRLAAPARGCVVVTTINRTVAAYVLTIAVAEYALGLVPRGTHAWSRYVTPAELQMAMGEAGWEMAVLAGMQLDPVSGLWACSQDPSVNYAALFERAP